MRLSRFPYKGAKLAKRTDTAHQLLSRIKGLDDDSIIAAAKLVTYDACYRNGYFDSNAVNSVNPDTDTCSNIRIMVNRACISSTYTVLKHRTR